MYHFKINGKPCQFETEWNELSPEKVLQLVPLVYAERNVSAFISVFRILCPAITDKLFRKIDAEARAFLVEKAAAVLDKQMEVSAVRNFTFQGITYYFPEPNLADVVLLEYVVAGIYLQSFLKQQSPESLNLLVATLCRPLRADLNESDPEWNGIRRERYNGQIAQDRAKLFADLPVEFKVIALQQFLAGKRYIHKQYNSVFVKTGEADAQDPEEVGQPKPAIPEANPIEQMGIIYSLAEQGIFGTVAVTNYTNVHEVFFYLVEKKQRSEE